MENRLKYRMYFFVNYQLTGIQQGIQAGHAALEYAHKFGYRSDYTSFIEKDKTWIILNGGTTNSSLDENDKPLGSLNLLHEDLWEADIKHAIFHEPDLNNALTAICFLADERVWDYENYPDIDLYLKDKLEKIQWLETFKNGPWTYEEIREKHNNLFAVWEHTLGGEKNVFLRNLIKGKKLA